MNGSSSSVPQKVVDFEKFQMHVLYMLLTLAAVCMVASCVFGAYPSLIDMISH